MPESLVERARLDRDGIGRAIYGETWPGPGGGDDSEMHIGHNVAEAQLSQALWAVVRWLKVVNILEDSETTAEVLSIVLQDSGMQPPSDA